MVHDHQGDVEGFIGVSTPDHFYGQEQFDLGAILDGFEIVARSNLAIAQTTALAALYAADQRQNDVRLALRRAARLED